jgi:hypothetical protein
MVGEGAAGALTAAASVSSAPRGRCGVAVAIADRLSAPLTEAIAPEARRAELSERTGEATIFPLAHSELRGPWYRKPSHRSPPGFDRGFGDCSLSWS